MRLFNENGGRMRGGLFGLIIGIVAFHTAHKEHADILAEFLGYGSDNLGYYQFLPALIGQHTMTGLPWAVPMETGNSLSMFTIGVAIMQLPFFLVGHLAAVITGAPLTGYSTPYGIANLFANATYIGLAFGLLYNFLRREYKELVVALSLVLIFFGTNLYYYSIHEVGMSHVYSFFLIAWLMYLTVNYVERPTSRLVVGLIFCAAMIVLVRQTNIVALLFPLLYGTGSWKAIGVRLKGLQRFKYGILIGVLLALSVWGLQLQYWHEMTNELLVFTYGEKGEGFNWMSPRMWDVLFSHQNGWFIYTPVMFFVVVAAIIKAAKGERNYLVILGIIFAVWYIYASWWCWWMGGAFGHRSFVEFYAPLSLPTAAMFMWILGRPWLPKLALIFGLALLVHINVSMVDIYQYPWEGEFWTWEKLIDVWKNALRRLK